MVPDYSKRDEIMNKSELFKKAHRYTKKTIQAGESYQVNFGQWLKVLNAHQKTIKNLDLNSILAIAKSGDAKALLANQEFQDVCQASVGYKGDIQSVDFNQFLNAEISEFNASKFCDAIANVVELELDGRNGNFVFNANTALREPLHKLSLAIFGKKLFKL